MEILAPQRPDRNHGICAGLVQFHKDAELGDPTDPPRQLGPDPVRQKGSQISVGRITFSDHRTPFSIADLFARFGQVFDIPIAEPVIAPSMRLDQRAVHDQVGIAADR